MSTLRAVGIAGLGRYVPERRLTNHDLESMVDTSDEWIHQRTGIRERRIARPDELTSDMATAAAREALADANVSAEELDLVICCTVTPDQCFPATACSIGHKLGATKAGGFDLSAACSGFVLGTQTAAHFVATGAAENVLVIGVEKLSSILDYKDRATCVIFGDGAGAAVVSPLARSVRGEYLGGSAGMKGGTEDVLSLPAGGTRFPTTHATIDQGLHVIHMQGKAVYRFAVKTFVDVVRRTLEPYGGIQALDALVPHQVNLRIIEAAAEELDLPMERILVNIDRYGNTSAASVPIALYEARQTGLVREGALTCCVAFGAGLTWGHLLFRW